MTSPPLISVVIISYNVKEYLGQALTSIRKALSGISSEIIVVDNASVDGSVAFLKKRFPGVSVIESASNLGFGRANNLALKKVRGEFVVLINPDTVVQENTFQKLLSFFESTPDAAAATCKILNPDGSFSVDCRHSIPTPLIAFWKVTGMSRLFPRSRIFAKYNLTYLDENQTYPVPAISGSFMMIRREALEKVGYFDERFFMYCEDIDLCERLTRHGYNIYYVPTTQIIHFKGQSAWKDQLDYVKTFNRSLYQFFQKHYGKGSLFIFHWIILAGIVVRGGLIYLQKFIKEHLPLILDLLSLNIVLLFAFIIRMQLKNGFFWQDYFSQYWVINALSSALFLAATYYFEVYPKHRLSVQEIIKANAATFMFLSALTFFLKQFAFSRMVVLMAAVGSIGIMSGWRAILKRFYKGDRGAWGKDLFSKPTLIVGEGAEVVRLYQKIRNIHDLGYELTGLVTCSESANGYSDTGIPVLGALKNLDKIIKHHRIRQIIFFTGVLTYQQILQTMSQIGNSRVEYKIVPSGLEVMIGKSYVDYLDDYPLLDIEYSVGKPFNRFVKRSFDLFISFLLLAFTGMVALPGLFFRRGELIRRSLRVKDETEAPVLQLKGKGAESFLNRYLLWAAVLRGRISLVGAPLRFDSDESPEPFAGYKPGLTGIEQINQAKIVVPEDREKYRLFYLKNQSLLLDLEIIFQTLFKS